MTEDTKTQKTAFDLFPDLFKWQKTRETAPATARKRKRDTTDPRLDDGTSDQIAPRKSTVAVPQPPDLSWLLNGIPEQDSSEDLAIRLGLVFISDERHRVLVAEVLELLGYPTHMVDNHVAAVDRLGRHTYSVIIADIADVDDEFHKYINNLPMSRRRLIMYVLIGAQLRTLYSLEALANSVNLVIGHKDLGHLEKILRWGFKEYANLYGPLLEVLNAEYPLLS